ncbi:MAG TPA: hypothetical protein VGX37_04020 [Allosphingosinicella sp.]|jgi:hypothetical protein|nr:hypothetical protein [Allosphingosinicella sp.]
MKKLFLAIAVALVPVTALAQSASPAPSAEADAVEEARQAVAQLDVRRLSSDRDYAAQILAHLDRLESAAGDAVEFRQRLDAIRIVTLHTLQRREEMRVVIGRMVERRSRDPETYRWPFIGALELEDRPLAVTVLEVASRNVPGVRWRELRDIVEEDVMWMLLRELRPDPPVRVRLAEALFRIGWPGTAEFGDADPLRAILVEDRLRRGDTAAAAEIAAGISSTRPILRMIVQPRFDAVLAPGRDRIEVLRAAIDAEDRATAGALASDPDDLKRLLYRAQHLRGKGHEQEALRLLEPLLSDPAATARRSEEGMWLVNEAAYSLVAQGRPEEGLRLMAPLAALPLAEHPYLISVSINYAELLFEAGHHQRAVDHATHLQADAAEFASDYGDLWIASALACSLDRLDRPIEAGRQIDRMRPLADTNPAAVTMAYLCLGRDDDAAALMVHRLSAEDPSEAILALQDYTLSRGESQNGALYRRLVALRERPDVRAALARVGRVMPLPLARTYWGGF